MSSWPWVKAKVTLNILLNDDPILISLFCLYN